MWKYRHSSGGLIAALVLLSTGMARGQWSPCWTNGDLFAGRTFAGEAYSSAVERCIVAGVSNIEPSWLGYLIGKQRAQLVNAKENYRALRPYIARRYLAQGTDFASYLLTNGLEVNKDTNDVYTLHWTNDAEFLLFCGLPTNYLDETPWFRLNDPGNSNGWHGIRAMATNATWFVIDVDETNVIYKEARTGSALVDGQGEDAGDLWSASIITSLQNSVVHYINGPNIQCGTYGLFYNDENTYSFFASHAIQGNEWRYDGMTNGQTIEIDIYTQCESPYNIWEYSLEFDSDYGTEFDQYGNIYATNEFIRCGTAFRSNMPISISFGSPTNTHFEEANWSEYPAGGNGQNVSGFEVTSRGWMLANSFAVIRGDVTNGFRFR